ncbi:G2/mitotic-specific cyclin [Quaeritorhiza haematococci]|nr:G2/mitotic-specific cyclin [Quaeritorhiza haematococci]
MFGTTQIQTRARAAAANAKKNGVENNENRAIAAAKAIKDIKDSKPTSKLGGTTKGVQGKKAAATAVKRAALGDLSNVQVQPNAATTKITKPRVTRSQNASQKGRKSSAVQAAKAAAAMNVLKDANNSSSNLPEAAKGVKPSGSQVSVKIPEAKRSKKDAHAVQPAETKAVVKKAAGTRSKTSSSSSALPLPAKEKPDEKIFLDDLEDNEPVAKKAKVEEEEEEWDDLDADDWMDPLMVSEYVVEIYEYMRELELQTMPNPAYMDDQKELAWRMRGILVDWLIEVHHKFRLLPETLYLAINIIDRFLSVRIVSLVKLQLVGVAAMFIAAKYEEVVHPSIQNFIYMADGGYTDEEILKAERYVLQVLDFSLQYPNPINFLRRCSKAENYDIQTRTLAKYLMEISLVDYRFLVYTPSIISAAGLFLARHMLNRGEWNANLQHYCGYKEHELKPVVDLTLDYLSQPCKHEALYKKYASKKFMKASIFVRDWMEKRRAQAAGGRKSRNKIIDVKEYQEYSSDEEDDNSE